MISFPNAKINIGLNVLSKREDGYHSIQSVLYPIGWHDALEAIPANGYGEMELNLSGLAIDSKPGENSCEKAYRLLCEKHKLKSLKVWLHKSIPMGAGLGGGSSDAAFFLKMLNSLFSLGLTITELKKLSAKIGSDCSFFIENTPALATGKGDILSPVNINLKAYFVGVVYPGWGINTASAYSQLKLTPNKETFPNLSEKNVFTWKKDVYNDFESALFPIHPLLKNIKDTLYSSGAIYASMTGSGSAVYGIFRQKLNLQERFPNYRVWTNS